MGEPCRERVGESCEGRLCIRREGESCDGAACPGEVTSDLPVERFGDPVRREPPSDGRRRERAVSEPVVERAALCEWEAGGEKGERPGARPAREIGRRVVRVRKEACYLVAVVGELEGETEGVGERAEGGAECGAAGDECGERERGFERVVGGLELVDPPDGGWGAGPGAAGDEDLERLAGARRGDGVEEEAKDFRARTPAGLGALGREFEGESEEEVAGDERDVGGVPGREPERVFEPAVERGLSAARVGIVDEVVVDEHERVKDLERDGHGEVAGSVWAVRLEGKAGAEEERGPEAFAGGEHGIGDDGGSLATEPAGADAGGEGADGGGECGVEKGGGGGAAGHGVAVRWCGSRRWVGGVKGRRKRSRWRAGLPFPSSRTGGTLRTMPDVVAPNLYLVGFMATGKTTFGRMVAHRLGMQFLDSDHAIEQAEGRSVARIFAEDGEAAFRALERRFIEDGHPAHGCVVACGGGLVVQPGLLEAVQSRGVVVCLHASPETILQRASVNRARPLLNAENPEERVRRLLAERMPVYQRAGTMLLTDGRPFQDIVDHLARVYRREAKDWARRTGAAAGAGT